MTRSAAEIRLRVGVEPMGPDGPKSLEEIGDEAERTRSLSALKSLLAGVPEFSTSPPNYGHRALSLLADEALVRILSVNWDTCIERASALQGRWVQATISDDDRRNATPASRLHKLYGCVTRPESLRVTTAEITAPAVWAAAEIQSALATGSVAFVGLGTISDQVRAAVEPVLANRAVADLVVITPTLSAAWSEMGLGSERHRAESGEAFLDALLCGAMTRLFAATMVAAERQAETDTSFRSTVDTLDRLVAVLRALPALPGAQWMRKGAGGLQPPAHLLTPNPPKHRLTRPAEGRNAHLGDRRSDRDARMA